MNLEYRCTIPHNAGGTYSGLTITGVGIKKNL